MKRPIRTTDLHHIHSSYRDMVEVEQKPILLTRQHIRGVQGQVMLLVTITTLAGYMIFGHYGVIIPSVFWALIGLGHVFNMTQSTTRAIDDPDPSRDEIDTQDFN